MFPIVGGRKVSHLKGNIEALGLELSEEDIKNIDSSYPFDIGFPMSFLGGTGKPKDVWLMNAAGNFDYVEGAKHIPPPKSLGEARGNPFKADK